MVQLGMWTIEVHIRWSWYSESYKKVCPFSAILESFASSFEVFFYREKVHFLFGNKFFMWPSYFFLHIPSSTVTPIHYIDRNTKVTSLCHLHLCIFNEAQKIIPCLPTVMLIPFWVSRNVINTRIPLNMIICASLLQKANTFSCGESILPFVIITHVKSWTVQK